MPYAMYVHSGDLSSSQARSAKQAIAVALCDTVIKKQRRRRMLPDMRD